MTSERPRWRSRAWLSALAFLAALWLLPSMVAGSPTSTVVLVGTLVLVGFAGIAWIWRRTVAQRKAYEFELEAWAAERAAQQERMRIAADLHDLVSHGLGLITVRAAGARSVQGEARAPEQEAALADIERAGRDTTTELRRMLTVLREPGAAPIRPAESLAELPSIVRDARRGGVEASLEWGALTKRERVSAGAQLVICSVVREALANAQRHAGPSAATVVLARDGGEIVVSVRDTGPRDAWVSVPGAGQGLAGVRERVAALGGSVTARPSGSGFELSARLPERVAA